MATVPTDIKNAIIASKRTIFWIDRLKNPLNIPPAPLSLEPEEELPNAEDPVFLLVDVRSILNVYNY
jgi:hypothetical protein